MTETYKFIPVKEKDEFLYDLYYNQNFRIGRDKLWRKVRETRQDIGRRYIWNWLSKQEVHQLYTQRKKKKDIRPIISNKAGAIIQADLIDFSNKPANGFRYILNVIDTFSRKIWLFPIKSKTTKSVIPALNIIIQEIQKDYKISVIQTDQGGEFNIAFPAIKALQSRGATPYNQAIVERANGTVKSILNKILNEKKTKNWYKFLDDLEEVYNNTYQTTVKMTPNEAYNLNKDEQADLGAKIKAKKAKSFKNLDTILEVNQKVRIVKPLLKIKNKGEPNYSTEIYFVSKVIKGNKENLTISRYKLKNENGVLQKNTYSISELLVLPKN